MRILHTSDWHVGKVLKGHSRVDEHLAVLASLVETARAEQPDLVIVAGDLFDSAAPSPDSTRIVTRALSALRSCGAEVVAIAGNHDNGAALDALRPWAEAAGISLRGTVRDRPDEHVVTGRTGSGEAWRLVALPFLSQRYAVRATEMFSLTAAEANQTYADHLARLIAKLCEGFATDTVNLVTTHVTVVGAKSGGGERDAHTIQAYAVPATVFPASAHYVALGHLHRAQAVPAPCPVRYSGAPLAVDFGEEENTPSVTLVDVTATTPAKVRDVPLHGAVPLRTVRGTLDELSRMPGASRNGQRGGSRSSGEDRGAESAVKRPGVNSGEDDGAWLRVYVRERPRAGLREAVQELLPRALEVRIDPQILAEVDADGAPSAQRSGRAPGDLFRDYLASRGHDDPAVRDLFDRLYAEVNQ